MEKVVGHSFQKTVTWQAERGESAVGACPVLPGEGVGEAEWVVEDWFV